MLFRSRFFFGTDTLTSKSSVVKRTRFHFFSEAHIGYHGTKEERSLSEGDFENVIVLSTEFYEEVIAHPIPTDFEVVRILSAAPAILDLFVWLSYRCFTARGKESIPIFGDFGLVQQIGTTEYTRPRRFRQKLAQWLRTIRLLWPECPAKISSDGLYLVIDHATAVLSKEQSAHI